MKLTSLDVTMDVFVWMCLYGCVCMDVDVLGGGVHIHVRQWRGHQGPGQWILRWTAQEVKVCNSFDGLPESRYAC